MGSRLKALLPALLAFTALAADAASVLRRGTSADAPTLDPVVAAGTLSAPIINDLFEGLLGKDAVLKLVPGSAESWTVSPDGRTYTFRLRPNLPHSPLRLQSRRRMRCSSSCARPGATRC